MLYFEVRREVRFRLLCLALRGRLALNERHVNEIGGEALLVNHLMGLHN
jgi:hypothetical protein